MTTAAVSSPLPTDISQWTSYFGRMGAGYDDHAFAGAALARWSAEEQHIVRESLGAGRGRSVLDIGCGTGRFSAPLDAAGWKVSALDGSAEMLDVIAERVPAASRHLGRLGERLPFDDASFDAIVAMRVVKYVRNTGNVLAELARVLRPGGRLVIDVPNRRSAARFGYRPDTIGFTTVGELRRHCHATGLAVTALHGAPRLPQPLLVRARSSAAGLVVAGVEGLATALVGELTGARAIVVEAVRAR